MKTVLILGANGRFGLAAVHAFAHAGWRVLAQTRRAAAVPWPQGVQPLQLAVDDPAALATAAAGASVVVHALNPPYAQWQSQALSLLHQGLAVADQLGARLMLPGNVYNYGTQIRPQLRESDPQLPDHPKAQIRAAMEQAMCAAAEAAHAQGHGLRCVVIRAGDFFGGGSGSWLDLAVVKNLTRGKLVYPGPLDVPHAWAYLPDLAQAFERVAAAPAIAPYEVLHFAGHTLTGQELLRGLVTAASALGVRPAQGFRTGAFPWGWIRALAPLHRPWREVLEMRYLWLRPHALDGSALSHRVALPAATPLDVALQRSLVALGIGVAATSV
ncbi:NAD-dependent epimerase/dehydratase family protein [Roseateles sp. BYS180W]|uniref:NAD-dependent epimerase/dehydratase family protein n=1 Tax=Roseateles rivi TaxID=3299028 RepID=A0ABW7FV88_9BURK